MKTKSITTTFTIYEKESELLKEDRQLLESAREAATRAYAKYSKFQVGAAILLANGEIVTGNNQENAVYPAGLCAERTTAFYASSRFPGVPFKKIAISAINPTEALTSPVVPCGSCRQVLSEYENRFNSPIKVILGAQSGDIWELASVADLLPLGFHAGFLPEK
ncbi:MAG: cytidine deaminase [Bacteroidales bacterium]|jgi:cytidine deaminase|nr:cytidine deaminase [Bacteroidales bacterium]MDD4395159.1 cytidine deaminase [Bacteroidales bacterium]